MPALSEMNEFPIESVRDIIAQVKDSGDVALRDLTKKFDGVVLDDLIVSEKAIQEAYLSLIHI